MITPVLFLFTQVISVDSNNVDCDKLMTDHHIAECLDEKTYAIDIKIEAKITTLAEEAVSIADDNNEIDDKFRKSRKDEIQGSAQHWFAYRDAVCLSDPDLNIGGTLGLITQAYCRLELSEKQLKDLDDL